MWLTRYLSLQDSQSKTIKARQAKLRRQNMVERGDRYFQLVRTITLPKKYAPMLPFELIIFNLPISITIEDLEDDDDDELRFKPFTTYSDTLYKLREDEEECLSEYVVEETEEKYGCISEEKLTNIFCNIFDLLSALYIIPPILRLYKDSKIMAIPTYNNNTLKFVINISFLLAPHTYFGRIRDFIEFIKFVDKPNNRWFNFCGRSTHLYSGNTPLGCPCLLDESSGDEGYDTD